MKNGIFHFIYSKHFLLDAWQSDKVYYGVQNRKINTEL